MPLLTNEGVGASVPGDVVQRIENLEQSVFNRGASSIQTGLVGIDYNSGDLGVTTPYIYRVFSPSFESIAHNVYILDNPPTGPRETLIRTLTGTPQIVDDGQSAYELTVSTANVSGVPRLGDYVAPIRLKSVLEASNQLGFTDTVTDIVDVAVNAPELVSPDVYMDIVPDGYYLTTKAAKKLDVFIYAPVALNVGQGVSPNAALTITDGVNSISTGAGIASGPFSYSQSAPGELGPEETADFFLFVVTVDLEASGFPSELDTLDVTAQVSWFNFFAVTTARLDVEFYTLHTPSLPEPTNVIYPLQTDFLVSNGVFGLTTESATAGFGWGGSIDVADTDQVRALDSEMYATLRNQDGSVVSPGSYLPDIYQDELRVDYGSPATASGNIMFSAVQNGLLAAIPSAYVDGTTYRLYVVCIARNAIGYASSHAFDTGFDLTYSTQPIVPFVVDALTMPGGTDGGSDPFNVLSYDSETGLISTDPAGTGLRTVYWSNTPTAYFEAANATFHMWLRFNSPNDKTYDIMRVYSPGSDHRIRKIPLGNRLQQWVSVTNVGTYTDNFPTECVTGQWHHIAFSRLGNYSYTHFDGQPLNSYAGSWNNLELRSFFDSADIDMSTVTFLNRALRDDEILTLYNTTRPPLLLPTGAVENTTVSLFNSSTTGLNQIFVSDQSAGSAFASALDKTLFVVINADFEGSVGPFMVRQSGMFGVSTNNTNNGFYLYQNKGGVETQFPDMDAGLQNGVHILTIIDKGSENSFSVYVDDRLVGTVAGSLSYISDLSANDFTGSFTSNRLIFDTANFDIRAIGLVPSAFTQDQLRSMLAYYNVPSVLAEVTAATMPGTAPGSSDTAGILSIDANGIVATDSSKAGTIVWGTAARDTFTNGSATFRAWIRFNSIQQNGMGILGISEAGKSYLVKSNDSTSNQLYVNYNGNNPVQFPSACSVGVWHHVAVTTDDATDRINVYFDGQLVNWRVVAWINPTVTSSFIGADISMADVSFSVGELNAPTILNIYNTTRPT